MPIRFRCAQCGQKLRVGDEKVGQSAKCPRCKSAVTVPATEQAIELPEPKFHSGQPIREPVISIPIERLASPDRPVVSLPLERLPIEQLPEIIIRDDDEDWMPSLATRHHDDETIVDYDKLAISRRVLYVQGALLGIVAIVAFVLGIVVSNSIMTRDRAAHIAEPCELSGQVTFGDQTRTPDDGSIVLVVPSDQRPALDARVAIAGLRPGDPLPAEDNISLRTLRSFGGEYARVNDTGEFQVRLANAGQYFVLVISRHAARSATEQLEKTTVAQAGRYFEDIVDLLADRKYRWQSVPVRDRKVFDVTF